MFVTQSSISNVMKKMPLNNAYDHYQQHQQWQPKRQKTQWSNQFDRMWKRSDWLFSLLRSTDDFYRQPIKLRLPLLFYLGHLPCFTWNQFRNLPGVNYAVDMFYDQLFQRGIDPDVQTGVVHHQHSSPYSSDEDQLDKYWRSFTVQNISDYKEKVREEIRRILLGDQLDFKDVATLDILNVALEHEMMHQETLLYLFAQLPAEALQSHLLNQSSLISQRESRRLVENPWISIASGLTSLGKPYHDQTSTYSFGWDNEFPLESTCVSSFEMQSHPIRNGDYLAFIQDQGYETERWWDEDVYQWMKESNISHPQLWTVHNQSYLIDFVIDRQVPIESILDHPVLVSQIEAKAYCRWLSSKTGKTIDLPTEVEWIYAMWDESKSIPSALKDPQQSNIHFRHLHTTPVESSTVEGKLQWQGSAFEWTSSVFRPFVNYRGDLATYPGYSSDFFDDQHFVLLGGSFATDEKLVRRTFRNWYRKDYRYMFATFRCVRRSGHTDNPLNEMDRTEILKSLNNVKHRMISSQYFYDAHGSALYEQITQLTDYYLFNQELKLLKEKANDIRKTILDHSNLCRTCPSTIRIIELGCGDGSKVETWLSPWIKSKDSISVLYQPLDISQHAIDSLVERLKRTLGDEVVEKTVRPICAPFEEMYDYLNQANDNGVKVMMLLGSTIGNFSSFNEKKVKYADDAPAMKFVRSVRSNLQIGDWFICGFDLCKNIPTMVKAYSDSKGVTKAFNLNLFHRLNRELNFNFDVEQYQHYALFNPLLRRMESWLVSKKRQTIHDDQGFSLTLEPFEAIQTEISTKYTQDDIEQIMKKNSLKIVELYLIDRHSLPYALCLSQAV